MACYLTSALSEQLFPIRRFNLSSLNSAVGRPNVNEDFTQANDLSASNPANVKELVEVFWKEAAKYNVLPLDWRAVERLNAELQGRPSLEVKWNSFTYYPGQIALPDGASSPVLIKSFTAKCQ